MQRKDLAGDPFAAATPSRVSLTLPTDYIRHITRAGLPRRPLLLNRYDRTLPPTGEAEVKYLDGDFRVVRPGSFVRCAVTGEPISLDELKYWSVDRQEAYVSPEAVLKRHKELAER